MGEFDSFLKFIAEELYEIERDIKRMLEFYSDAEKRVRKLGNDIEKEKNKESINKPKLKKMRKEYYSMKKYVKILNKEINKRNRMSKKVAKFVDTSKEIKAIVMTNRIGGDVECPSTSLNVRSVKKKSKKYSGRRKKKTSKRRVRNVGRKSKTKTGR